MRLPIGTGSYLWRALKTVPTVLIWLKLYQNYVEYFYKWLQKYEICMFSPLYLKIFEKSPFLMKTPTQNFAHHTEVKKHPFGVKTPILATLALMADAW